jgi:hypothetical protein
VLGLPIQLPQPEEDIRDLQAAVERDTVLVHFEKMAYTDMVWLWLRDCRKESNIATGSILMLPIVC